MHPRLARPARRRRRRRRRAPRQLAGSQRVQLAQAAGELRGQLPQLVPRRRRPPLSRRARSATSARYLRAMRRAGPEARLLRRWNSRVPVIAARRRTAEWRPGAQTLQWLGSGMPVRPDLRRYSPRFSMLTMLAAGGARAAPRRSQRRAEGPDRGRRGDRPRPKREAKRTRPPPTSRRCTAHRRRRRSRGPPPPPAPPTPSASPTTPVHPHAGRRGGRCSPARRAGRRRRVPAPDAEERRLPPPRPRRADAAGWAGSSTSSCRPISRRRRPCPANPDAVAPARSPRPTTTSRFAPSGDRFIVQAGQFDAPFTLENRTSDAYTTSSSARWPCVRSACRATRKSA